MDKAAYETARVMKRAGCRFVRHTNRSHQMWVHVESGKLITVGPRLFSHRHLEAYVRQLLSGGKDATEAR